MSNTKKINELKSKIEKLKKGMSAKAATDSAKSKAKVVIAKYEKEIESLQVKPKRKATKTTQTSVAKARLLAAKRRAMQGLSTSKSDIEKDAQRPALPAGRRVSKNGNVYHETRENRIDRRPKRYARLEDGGEMMAKGGTTYGRFEGVMAKYAHSVASTIDRSPKGITFSEMKDILEKEFPNKKFTKVTLYAISRTLYKTNDYIISDKKEWMDSVIKNKKPMAYADGGEMMAKGGMMSGKYEVGIDEGAKGTRTIADFEKESDAKKFMYDYSLRNPKAKLFIDTVTDDYLNEYADGEMMAKGGKIKNQYEGRTAEDVWDSWSIGQRFHFLKDHYMTNLEKTANRQEYSSAHSFLNKASRMNWEELPKSVHSEVELHLYWGQYADGGEMAKGGIIEEGDVVLVKSEGLEAEVIRVTNDNVVVEFINRRPDGGEKRANYKLTQLKKMADGGEMAFGGRLKSALMRDRAYQSDEEHEKRYVRKSGSSRYQKHEMGGEMHRSEDSSYANGGMLEYMLDSGFSISQMKEFLRGKFPDSFGFTLARPDNDMMRKGIMKNAEDTPFRGLTDADINNQKVYFPQYRRDHEINFRIHQGSENTYFEFYLNDKEGNPYIGNFGFKDEGDVSPEYITGFIVFLMECYKLPIQVRHEAYGNGGMS